MPVAVECIEIVWEYDQLEAVLDDIQLEARLDEELEAIVGCRTDG